MQLRIEQHELSSIQTLRAFLVPNCVERALSDHSKQKDKDKQKKKDKDKQKKKRS